jgi:cobalt-zinc-cadmium resistance protein CzcA
MSLQNLRRDVFPDLSAPVFNVIVQNAAMGAEELETGISIPLEAALAGLPDIRRVRSVSHLGVCQVTVEFEPDADYYRARQFVAERVNQIGSQLQTSRIREAIRGSARSSVPTGLAGGGFARQLQIGARLGF